MLDSISMDGFDGKMESTAFRQALARLMASHKLSQGRLAETMGCDQSTVCRLLSGALAPNLKNIYTIIRLCRAFPLDAAAILATLRGDLHTFAMLELTRAIPIEAVTIPPAPVREHTSEEDRIAQWMAWFRALPPTERHEMFEILALLAKRCSTPPPK